MKTLLSISLIVLAFGFSSCKKCQEQDCQNGATCTILNGEATCECTDFWEGDKCDSEIRNGYYGTYSGTVKYGSLTQSQSFVVSSDGTRETDIKIATGTGSSDVTWYVRLTDNNEFNIRDQSGVSGSFEGTGRFDASSFSMSGTYQEVSNGRLQTVTFEVDGFK